MLEGDEITLPPREETNLGLTAAPEAQPGASPGEAALEADPEFTLEGSEESLRSTGGTTPIPPAEGSGSLLRDMLPQAVLPKRKRSAVWEWVETIVIALILAMVLRTFVVQPFEVHLSSMNPTLMEGDYILVSKLAYKLGNPSRGDVVVFLPPNGSERDYVKRVIALPGEMVDILDGQVKVNGVEIPEPYAVGTTNGGRYNHLQIPEGTIFVMGDNRMNSSDSRNFGPVSISALEGKSVLLFWPFGRFKWAF